MINIILRLALINLLFAGVLFIQGYWYWLLNFELAFISSVFIILGSFHGYKKMINRRLEVGEGMNNELMDKLEDPYNLYDDESENLDIENDQKNEVDLVTVVKEEKKRLKQDKQTIKKTIQSTPGIFSPLRFIPYAVLIMSFIALNNNHILDVVAFLVGLGVGIAIAIFLGKKWISLSE
ncbi:MAG: hypothetical protein COA44_11630 [Arcobacter sp.]|nr:MAG: hypothetical protein COA44_11630 [Arcobacter sp.]